MASAPVKPALVNLSSPFAVDSFELHLAALYSSASFGTRNEDLRGAQYFKWPATPTQVKVEGRLCMQEKNLQYQFCVWRNEPGKAAAKE